MLWYQYGPVSLRKLSSTLPNLCHEELREFSRQNRGQHSTSNMCPWSECILKKWFIKVNKTNSKFAVFIYLMQFVTITLSKHFYQNNLMLYVQWRLAVEAVSKPVCVHCRDQCSIVLFWIVCKDMLPIRIHWILNCILIADLFPRHCPLRHKEHNIFS